MRIQIKGLLVLLAVGVGPAHAAFFQNTTGLATPMSTVTFSEHAIPQDAPITMQFSDVGLTFQGVFSCLNYSFPNIATPQAANFSHANPAGTVVNPFSIHFNTVQSGAAVAMISNGGTSLWEALLNNSVVASGTGNQVNMNANYYGFSGIEFDQIRVTINGWGGLATFDSIEMNPQIAPVPEPSTYAAGLLLALVFGFQGVRQWRRLQLVKIPISQPKSLRPH